MCNHKKDSKNKSKRGTGLENGQAHEQDHKQWSRRTFIRQMGMAGTASFFLGNTPLSAISTSPLAKALMASGPEDDRILVLIRLNGGNDGLNTIIPVFDYGTYQNARQNIAIPQNELISLTDELAMPNTMSALENMWLDGQMKLVNNVGYPDPNLSHFRSTDIWASATNSDVESNRGWLGGLLEQEYPDFLTNPPEIPPAIQMGSSGNIVFNDSSGFDRSLNVANPEQLLAIAQTGQLYDPLDVPGCHYGEQLSYVRSVANNTFRYAEIVANAYEEGSNSVEYANNDLATQLALVARLIRGGLGTRLYMVVHNGFDTHVDESNRHPGLINELANAVSNFHTDLGNADKGDKVLSMTFSEFGRRIQQNASGGTDHGTAAPLFLFGEGLNGNGSLGGLPDLQEIDQNGNLIFTTDFRQIYATVLEQWLCIDADVVDQVLGQPFERLSGLDLSCNAVNTWSPQPQLSINLKAYYHGGQLHISYDLAASHPVSITLYNMLGQPMKKMQEAYQLNGHHQYSYSLSDIGWASGIYAVNLQVGKQQYAQQIRLVK